MVRVYRYYVAGCGSFPFKLLARDQAWPADDSQAELIELACPTQAPRQMICLASHAHPTVNAWAASKWPVLKVDA